MMDEPNRCKRCGADAEESTDGLLSRYAVARKLVAAARKLVGELDGKLHARGVEVVPLVDGALLVSISAGLDPGAVERLERFFAEAGDRVRIRVHGAPELPAGVTCPRCGLSGDGESLPSGPELSLLHGLALSDHRGDAWNAAWDYIEAKGWAIEPDRDQDDWGLLDAVKRIYGDDE